MNGERGKSREEFPPEICPPWEVLSIKRRIWARGHTHCRQCAGVRCSHTGKSVEVRMKTPETKRALMADALYPW